MAVQLGQRFSFALRRIRSYTARVSSPAVRQATDVEVVEMEVNADDAIKTSSATGTGNRDEFYAP